MFETFVVPFFHNKITKQPEYQAGWNAPEAHTSQPNKQAGQYSHECNKAKLFNLRWIQHKYSPVDKCPYRREERHHNRDGNEYGQRRAYHKVDDRKSQG